MHVLSFAFGLLCCAGVMLDAFQTVILPRRPTGRLRITRFFYLVTWGPWVALGRLVRDQRKRDQLFSVFGPLSLLFLLALWALLLTVGFGLIYFGLGTPFGDALNPARGIWANLRTDLYVSGTTLFTLGLGDVTPLTQVVRAAFVIESGTGLGFVALVIGYVPVLYQAFSRREVSVAMLDGRAGSPPTAAELLRRHGYKGGEEELIGLLAEWERWSAEILESHISYPILCYYRSQHDNQSWISALVAILDTCALLITTIDGPAVRQAQLTFTMARHALIDLGHVFGLEKRPAAAAAKGIDRLTPAGFGRLCETLGEMHQRLCGDPEAMRRLAAIRLLYEPFAQSMAEYLQLPLPPWIAEAKPTDLWRRIADLRVTPAQLPGAQLAGLKLPDTELQAAELPGVRLSEPQLSGSELPGLRSQVGSHVSAYSLATHLHDEEHGH